jgi:Flp pilus assembly protein TadD
VDPLRELLEFGNVEEARAQATARVAKNPKDAFALVALAKLALSEFDAPVAEGLLRQAEAIGITGDTQLIRAGLAIGAGDVPAAKNAFQKATELQPDLAEAFMGYGLALGNEEDYGLALEALKTAVTLNPSSGPFHYHLGQCYLELEDIPRAVEHVGRSIELDPIYPPAYVTLSRCLTMGGKFELARKLVKEGLAFMPDNPQLIAELTNISLVGGDPAGAFEAAQKLALAQPNNPLAQNNLALLLLAQRRFDEALKICRTMDATGTSTAALKCIEGSALECLDPADLDGAAKAYEAAMVLDPADWKPANNLGLLLLSRKDGDTTANVARAVVVLEDATRREPGQLEPLLNLAIAYSRNEQKAKGKDLAQLILAYNLPETSSVREQAQRLVKALS